MENVTAKNGQEELEVIIKQSRVQPDMSNKWPELVSIIDEDGILLHVSESHEAALGWPAEVLLNTPLASMATESDREAFESQLETLVRTQQLTRFSFRAWSTTGVVRIEAQAVPLVENNLFPGAYLVVGRRKTIVELTDVAEAFRTDGDGTTSDVLQEAVQMVRERRRAQA